MLVTQKDLQRLLEFQAPSAQVVSLYLAAAGDSFAALRRKLSDAEGRRLRVDLAKLERAAAQRRGPLAAFSCEKQGLWRVFPLNLPPRPGLTVGAKPYLAPLLSLTDQHQRYGVAVLGSRPRFLEAYLGSLEERTADLETSDPTKLASALEALTRRQGLQRLILVAPDELRSKLQGRLHTLLQDNLILDSSLDPEMDDEAVAERLLAREREAREVREQVLAARLLDEAAAGRGVTGLAGTLAAFREGRVRRLIVRDGFAKLGRSCAGCGRLSFEESRCVLCGRSTEIMFDLVGELVDRTLKAGGEAITLFHKSPLDNVGRIGAELAPAVREAVHA